MRAHDWASIADGAVCIAASMTMAATARSPLIFGDRALGSAEIFQRETQVAEALRPLRRSTARSIYRGRVPVP
jgi:hypothetical protein